MNCARDGLCVAFAGFFATAVAVAVTAAVVFVGAALPPSRVRAVGKKARMIQKFDRRCRLTPTVREVPQVHVLQSRLLWASVRMMISQLEHVFTMSSRW